MAAKKGNKIAQKHSKEHVMSVLEDCIDGMQLYATTKTKHNGLKLTTETVEHTGYSCVERAMVANGHYRNKINEWEKTWKDDQDVSDAIKKIRSIADDMIIINTSEGKIPTSFGIFLCKTRLGMVEKGVEMEVEANKSVLKIVSVKPDGTRVER